MLNNTFVQEKLNEFRLFGFFAKHTLEQDQQQNITSSLIQKVQENVNSKEILYLVQIYDDAFLDTQEFITFVGVKKATDKFQNSISIPRTIYWKTHFSPSQENVDEVYASCYRFFEEQEQTLESNFEVEKINFDTDITELFFPINNVQLTL